MAKKKTSTLHKTHPILGYRVLSGIRDSITEMLEDVLEVYNEELGDDEKPYKKNDIFIMALKKGLKQLLRDKK